MLAIQGVRIIQPFFYKSWRRYHMSSPDNAENAKVIKACLFSRPYMFYKYIYTIYIHDNLEL